MSAGKRDIAIASAGHEVAAAGVRAMERLRGARVVHLADFEEAVALAPSERDAYRRRFLTLFADESTCRRGGLGRVVRVANALGERFALKTLTLPERDELETEEDHAAHLDMLRAAFRAEYEAHRALGGFRGFPRLYGYGMVDGVPAIVMEWIEGETLARARLQLAVDDEDRVSPLTVGRLGRDLFGLLTRMDAVGEGFVHRDISPANIMVRTNHLSVKEQETEGVFDLCLIDFGSSSPMAKPGTSFTETYAVARKATAAYAPPEMLSDDLRSLDRLQKSPAIDVYAAASVLYELLAGTVPFPAACGAELGAEQPSLFRRKMDGVPEKPLTSHGAGADIRAVLLREPDAAVAATCAAMELPEEPDESEMRSALAFVDAQLVEMIMACLVADQDKRPSAGAMRAGMEAFCLRYAENVALSLRREPLIPCMSDGSWFASAPPFAARRLVRSVGKSIALGVWCVVVASAALLLDGAEASFGSGGHLWEGTISGFAVAAALALPAVFAWAISGRVGTSSGKRFAVGTAVLVVLEAAVAALVALLAFDPAGRSAGALAAVLATTAAAWFMLVLDYAIAVIPALLGERRRALLAPDDADATITALPSERELAGELPGDVAGPEAPTEPIAALAGEEAVASQDPAAEDGPEPAPDDGGAGMAAEAVAEEAIEPEAGLDREPEAVTEPLTVKVEDAEERDGDERG